MSNLYKIRKVYSAAIGTDAPVGVLLKARTTGEAIDISGYTYKVGVKASGDETATYIISPITGTTAATGKASATIPAASITAVGDYVLEHVLYLSGTAKYRVQQTFSVSARVVVS